MTTLIDEFEEAAVDSSVFTRVYFVPEPDYAAIGDLYVRFHDGRVAGYSRVPVTIWRKLLEAQSPGKFWRNNIQRAYRGKSGDVEFVDKPVAQAASPFNEWLRGEIEVEVPQADPTPLFEFDVTYTLTETTRVRANSFDAAIQSIKNGDENIQVKKVELVDN